MARLFEGFFLAGILLVRGAIAIVFATIFLAAVYSLPTWSSIPLGEMFAGKAEAIMLLSFVQFFFFLMLILPFAYYLAIRRGLTLLRCLLLGGSGGMILPLLMSLLSPSSEPAGNLSGLQLFLLGSGLAAGLVAGLIFWLVGQLFPQKGFHS